MVRRAKTPGSICVKDHNLLERVMSYYQHILSQSGRELDSFRERLGLKDKQTLIDFGAGFADGTLRDVLPSDEDLLGRLEALGVIDGEGHDVLAGQLVFPLQDGNGALVTLCGLRVDDRAPVTPLLLDNARAGIVCARAVRRAESVILCRSIPDALALHDRGLKSSMAVCGPADLVADLTYLLRRQVRAAYLVHCSEEIEETGTEALRSGLEKHAIPTHEINLPSGDIRTFFARHTAEEFKALLQKTGLGGEPVPGKAGERTQRFYRTDEDVGYGDAHAKLRFYIFRCGQMAQDAHKSELHPFALTYRGVLIESL